MRSKRIHEKSHSVFSISSGYSRPMRYDDLDIIYNLGRK
jgi:hypothetical protein